MEEINPHHASHGGHEETDVNVWAVGRFAIALAAICIVSLTILWGLYRYFESLEGSRVEKAMKLPPAPNLQTAPIPDLKAFRDAEDKMLNSYGWIDQQKGIVHIPIDRAIDMVAQRGGSLK
jgi:hypothetical protein